MELKADLLLSSYAAIAPRSIELADRFFDKLNSRYPEVARDLGSLRSGEQKQLLISFLSLAIGNLGNPARLNSAAQQIAHHGRLCGVKRSHYPTFGKVLLNALADITGDQWTDDLMAAWSQAWSHLLKLIETQQTADAA